MRKNGILMPIFSLPSRYGIGTVGKEAYRFVDFLEAAGQSCWQILPIGPTSFGDSPYQSFSTYAGNPYFIDLEELISAGLITAAEADAADFGSDPFSIDYGLLYQNRLPLLETAFSRFSESDEYREFCRRNAYWLDDYALFMALKDREGGRSWTEWPQPLKTRDDAALAAAREELSYRINFYKFLQFTFSVQWHSLKSYANKKGIEIIGDIPIYVALDSADVWANTDCFQLDSSLTPKAVAGCPPDAFSEDGQLWGNPLYDWAKMKKNGYEWWCRRMAYALSVYDTVRIDHFRGLESYYSIPYGDATAKNGVWKKGPGMSLFTALKLKLGSRLPLIAEDLGYLTDAVLKLLDRSGFPGMKVLQFAFDSREESDYLPHNYPRNCVVYTGTHDNDTIRGWTHSANKSDVKTAYRYLGIPEGESLVWPLMRAAMSSVADTCILMMPDLVDLGSEGRINTPATSEGNWLWRIDGGCINDWLAKIIYDHTALYGRLNKAKKAEE
ncbi:MAG: 4-alpha-glucanotransferase [Clostridia bacterium]|nr:4-alpha-glucanotransferase [Clostridia bacterium]